MECEEIDGPGCESVQLIDAQYDLEEAQAENKKLRAGPEWTAFENEVERRLALRVQEIEDGWRQEIITANEVRDKADAKNEKLRAIVVQMFTAFEHFENWEGCTGKEQVALDAAREAAAAAKGGT